jgi:glycosyltransferase involved in cell wall biosynthesis
MKILHVSFSSKGGPAIGIKRLHNALKKKKIKSELFFFLDNLDQSQFSLKKLKWKIIFFTKRLIVKFLTVRRNKESLSLNLFDNLNLNSIVEKKKIDVVHLHWVGNEMISIKEIASIRKPVIWTFHDMWPFAGAEHFCYDNRFLNMYQSTSRKKNEFGLDLDGIVWKEKLKFFSKKKFYITVPSKWMLKNIIKSKLFKNSEKFFLPNIIDLSKWKLKNNKKSNKKKIELLFVATSSVNYRKGFGYLFDAINKYLDKNKYSLLVIGEKPKKFDELKIEKRFLPTINSETKLIKTFKSSDIFVVPSIAESFGQVFVEAGSIGLLSIAFDGTAVSEIICHKKNGYLAKFKSSKDLAKGIMWATKKANNNYTKKNNRKYVINNFSAKKKINEFIRLYKYSYVESKNYHNINND